MIYFHHDDLRLESEEVQQFYDLFEDNESNNAKLLELDDRTQRLVKAFRLWVNTVRGTAKRGGYVYNETWLPGPIDCIKSRLFWWIRSGHEPLPFPPPTAYSCPWYEVITEQGNHHVYDLHEYPEGSMFYRKDKPSVSISQSIYDILERKEDGSLILAYGPWRFRAFRDAEKHADVIGEYNKHDPTCRERVYESDKDDMNKCWFLCRLPELEQQTL